MGPRTVQHMSMAAHYVSTGKLGMDNAIVKEIEYAFSSNDPNVLRDYLYKPLSTSTNNSWPVDNENGFAFYIAMIWKVFGGQNIATIIKSVVFINIILSFLLFIIAHRLNGQLCAYLTLFFSFLFTPALKYGLELRIHWFVVPAIIMLAWLTSTRWQRLKNEWIATLCCTLLLALLTIIRSSVAPLLIAWVFILLFSHGLNRKFLILAFTALFGFVCTKSLINQQMISDGGKASYHTKWYPMFVGLAELPSSYGGFYPRILEVDEDGEAWKFAEKINPEVEKFTPEWDNIFKDKIRELFKLRPDLFLEMYSMRLTRVLLSIRQDWSLYPYLPGKLLGLLFAFCGIFGLFRMLGKTDRRFAAWPLSMLCGMYLFASVVVLAKLPQYYIGWTLIYCFTTPYLLSILMKKVPNRFKREVKA